MWLLRRQPVWVEGQLTLTAETLSRGRTSQDSAFLGCKMRSRASSTLPGPTGRVNVLQHREYKKQFLLRLVELNIHHRSASFTSGQTNFLPPPPTMLSEDFCMPGTAWCTGLVCPGMSTPFSSEKSPSVDDKPPSPPPGQIILVPSHSGLYTFLLLLSPVQDFQLLSPPSGIFPFFTAYFSEALVFLSRMGISRSIVHV